MYGKADGEELIVAERAAGSLAGAEVMREFIPASPFASQLGIEIVALEADRAVLRLPFSQPVATIGDVVHGGAIGALVDTAAMAAAWATDEVPDDLRGTTVGLSIDYLRAARGCDLVATARVLRRGGSLCFCDVGVAGEGDQLVAKALVTYKLG